MKESKLSKQQKKILKALGKESKKGRGMDTSKLNRLISNYNLSDTKRASISRSTKRLINRGLLYRKTSHYMNSTVSDFHVEGRVKCNVLFTTDKGKKVYNDLEKVNKRT